VNSGAFLQGQHAASIQVSGIKRLFQQVINTSANTAAGV
jgi:hypothetical protein